MTTNKSRADALTDATLADARSALYGIAKTYDDSELRAKALEAYEATFSAPVELPAAAASSTQRFAVNDAVQVLEQNWEFATAERLRDAFPVKRQADYTGVRDDSDSVTQSSQPAAAPIDAWVAEAMRLADLHAYAGKAEDIAPNREALERHLRTRAQPAPSPADERATYGSTDFGYTFVGIDLEEGDKRLMALLVRALGTDHPAIEDMTALLFRARAASANETGAEGAKTEAEIRKTMTPEQIRLERKLTCEAIDGAMAFGYQNTNPPPSADHWLASYWHVGRKQAELESRSPAMAAEAVATLHDDGYYVWNPKVAKPGGYDRAGWKMPVYASPQPAQADARVGLTAGERNAIERAISEVELCCQFSLAAELRALLAAHPGQPEPIASADTH